MQIRTVNKNLVEIVLPSGKVFTVTSDNETALNMAFEILDWSEMFTREDSAEEVTQIIAVA